MNLRSRLGPVLAAYLLLVAPSLALAQVADSAAPSITSLRGNVYRAQHGARTTVFFVSASEILLVDPLNLEFARWLKQELQARFPDRPVTNVLYSDVDFDRIGGAAAFAPPATVFAHSAFGDRFNAARSALPASLRMHDRDANGVLDRDEIAALETGDALRLLDRDQDGRLTADESWSGAGAPSTTYRSRHTIAMGDQRVELLYAGPAMGEGATVVFFPSERLVFAARHPSLSAPFADETVRAAQLATWMDRVAALDFDTLISADGTMVSRAQLNALGEYVGGVVSAVASARGAGRSLESAIRDPRIAKFDGTAFAGSRAADLEAVYRRTRPLLVEAYGAGLVNHVSTTTKLCNTGEVCEFGSASGRAFSAGGGVSVGQFRFASELSVGQQMTLVAEQGRFSRLDLRWRDRSLSFLAGFQASPSSGFSVAALAGPTFVTTRITFARSSTGSGGTLEESALAFTFGGDVTIAVGARVRLIVPIRLTTVDEGDLPRSGLDTRIGAGLTVALFRSVR